MKFNKKMRIMIILVKKSLNRRDLSVAMKCHYSYLHPKVKELRKEGLVKLDDSVFPVRVVLTDKGLETGRSLKTMWLRNGGSGGKG